MATSRPKRLFTTSEVIESIFTAGSGDEIDDSEDDRDYDNDLEDESDLLGDVPDRGIDREAAVSESSFSSTSRSRSRPSSAASATIPSPLTRPRSRSNSSSRSGSSCSYQLKSRSSSQSSNSESDPAAVEIDQDPQDPYNAVTEVEFDDQADSDMDSDVEENGESQWVKNVNHFPPIPLFTGQPGIKAAIPDDPSPIDIYNLFITDELIAEWKTETNVMQEQSSTLKTCSCFQIEADSKNGSQ